MVLCDRYGDSTLAYQGYGHGLNLDSLRAMLQFATEGLKPDLTLLMDLDIKTGLARKKSIDEWNRLDAYEISFHERVRSGYQQLAKEEPERWQIVDASQSKEQVQTLLRQIVLNRLKDKI